MRRLPATSGNANRMITRALLAFLVGCKPGDVPLDDGVGLVGDGWANPFPNAQLMVDGRIAIPANEVPPSTPTPLPVGRVAWREGRGRELPPVLVTRIDEEWALIDGHSRALAALERGEAVIRVKVEKLEEIMKYGVAFTPALVIDGTVKAAGGIPKAAQIEAWLQEAAAKE